MAGQGGWAPSSWISNFTDEKCSSSKFCPLKIPVTLQPLPSLLQEIAWSLKSMKTERGKTDMNTLSFPDPKPELKCLFWSALWVHPGLLLGSRLLHEAWVILEGKTMVSSLLVQWYFEFWSPSPCHLLLLPFLSSPIAAPCTLYWFHGCIQWERQGRGYLLLIQSESLVYILNNFIFLHYSVKVICSFKVLYFLRKC